jgi:ADP-heptose:LPS heptosyltransferase
MVDRRGIPPVGTTSFGGAVEVLRGLDGYIGFSSGLGHVAAHCCGTPVFMLWPDHEQPLSTSWVDPELLANGFYVPSKWLDPKAVWAKAKLWLRRVAEGQYVEKEVAHGS